MIKTDLINFNNTPFLYYFVSQRLMGFICGDLRIAALFLF